MQQFQRGEYERALGTFETAVDAYAAQDDVLGQAEMLNNIGVVHRTQRDYEAAHAALKKAATLFAHQGDLNRQAQTLGNMADLFAAEGNRETAARYYSDASELFAREGDGEKQGDVLRALSLMRLQQGQWLESLQLMEKSLSVRSRIGVGGRLFRALLRFALRLLTGS